MKNEDTFSLTSIKEERPMGLKIGFNSKQLKLPHIKSQQSFSKPSKKLATAIVSQKSQRKTTQNSVTHDLLKSITERASQ